MQEMSFYRDQYGSDSACFRSQLSINVETMEDGSFMSSSDMDVRL